MTHRLLVGGELVLYGSVGDLYGDGSGFTAKDVLEALAEHGSADLSVRVNSGGGLAWDGIAIYNALSAHPGKVTVTVDGIAASAASIIAMGGVEIRMATGSTMMIHDPAAIVAGPAEQMRKSADLLDQLAEQGAAIYAKQTGKPAPEMRDLMLAETWMRAEKAVSDGFATGLVDSATQAVAAFDYRGVYQHTPSTILQTANRPFPAKAAAPSASPAPKEISMSESTAGGVPVITASTPAPIQAKDHTRDIMNRCNAAKMTLDEATAILDAAGNDPAKAKDLILDAVMARDPSPQRGPQVLVVADSRDKFREGATKGLMARVGMSGGERNEFAGMTLRELAKASLAQSGQAATFNDPMQMVRQAFAPVMAGGSMSSSDFSNLLADVAHKSMLKGWEESEETFEKWTSTGSLSDFKAEKRVDLNLFPSLAAVPEGAEYTYGKIGDRGETIQLATYGKMFAITRQAIINDDLNAFSKIPMRMGRSAKRTIGGLVYAILTGNPTMADSVALFHASHANYTSSGTAISATSVDLARSMMAKQADPDSYAAGGLNIRPAYFLVPVELEGKAQQLMASETDLSSSNSKAPNYVRGIATVISDARLSTASATAWYLAASPMSNDTIEVAYLNGNSTPYMEERAGWDVDGVEFKVRIDAGVKALDHRGLYKNVGA